MRYGHGTWVDADGARTHVPARFVDGLVELRVPSSVVEASAYPSVLDPSVGPEFPVEPPVYPGAKELISGVAVGYGGGVYLVLWQDSDVNNQVLAVRVRATDALVLDATPTVLGGGFATSQAAIAFDGNNFLVAWSTGSNLQGALSGAVVRLRASDGALLDPPGGLRTPAGIPSVTYASGSYIEAWNTLGTVSEVAIGSADAAVGAAKPVATAAAPDMPATATNGTNVLIAWTDTRNGLQNADVYGSLSGPASFPISQNFAVQTLPAAASDGTDFFVAWYDMRTNAGIYGTRVRASDGTPLDGALTGIQVSSLSAAVSPRVSFDGSSYVVVYSDAGNVHAVRVRPSDGALLDGPASAGGITVTTTASSSPPLAAIASSSTESLVAWVAGGSGAPAVKAARIRASDGVLLDPTALTISPPLTHPLKGANAETAPLVATDGTRYFVAWADNRYAGASPTSFGASFGSAGEPLFPAAVPLLIAPNSLASAGTSFLATSGDAGVSTRIRASDGVEIDAPVGIPLRGAPLSSCTTQSSSACLGGTCLVAVTCFIPRVGFPTKEQVIVQRVRASDGMALDGAGIQVTATPDSGNSLPVVGAGTSSFLVAWRNYVTGVSAVTRAARVDLAGNVSPPFTVALGEDPEAVASDGANFLVLSHGTAVWGTRVRESDLTLIDGLPGQGAIPVAAATVSTHLSATYDGQSYVVAFGDTRSGAAGLYASRIRASDGALLDGPPSNSGFLVRADSVDAVSIASPGQGRSLIVSSSLRGAPYGVVRVSGQLIDESDAGIDAGGGAPDSSTAGEAGGPTDTGLGLAGDAAFGGLADVVAVDGASDLDGGAPAGDASASDATTPGAARDASVAGNGTGSLDGGTAARADAAGAGGSGDGGGGCQAGSVRGANGVALVVPAWALLVALRRRRRAHCRQELTLPMRRRGAVTASAHTARPNEPPTRATPSGPPASTGAS